MESDCVDLDLQNDYIGFGYYREINFVQEDFQGFYQSHLEGSSHRTHCGSSQEGYEVG